MEQRFAVKSLEVLSQNVFLNNEIYLVCLKSPKDPMNRPDRTRAVGALGTEEGSLAQIPQGKEVTLWIETPGLETGQGLEQESLGHVKLRIVREQGEERMTLLEKELDLRQQEIHELRLDFSQEKEPVLLYGMLELPESDKDLSSYARVWIRTSLTGRQIFPNAAYYTGESGAIETGWVEDAIIRMVLESCIRAGNRWTKSGIIFLRMVPCIRAGLTESIIWAGMELWSQEPRSSTAFPMSLTAADLCVLRIHNLNL